MSNRRNFIRNSFSLANGLLLFPSFGKTMAGTELPDTGLRGTDPEAYWKKIRGQFPLKKDFIYFNNGTIGPSPYPVLEAVTSEMLHLDETGVYAGWEITPEKIAGFINAGKDEICLTHNVTEGINIICWGLSLQKGDEIIITDHEHVGNALPWLNRSHTEGLSLKILHIHPSNENMLEQLEALVTERTKVIAIPHMPCTNGQILPVKEIAAFARKRNIFSFIDGAHGTGMLNLDMKELDCDFYSSCCHKWLMGAKGTGYLYIKKEKLDSVKARWVGGGSDKGWDLLTTPPKMDGYVDSAHRFYYGTQNTALYHGVNAAIQFQENILAGDKYAIENRLRELSAYLYQHLQSFGERVEIITPFAPEQRCGIIAFRLPGKDFMHFYNYCVNSGIRIRAVLENGINCLRVSTHIYNSKKELDTFAETLSAYLKK